MTDQSVDMWNYYREKYGVADALESYFTSYFRENISLQVSLAQIKNAEIAIDVTMTDLLEND